MTAGPEVQIITTWSARSDLLSRIRRLLNEAFDGDFPHEDWQHTLGGWHILIWEAGALLSHAAVVPRPLEVGGRPLRTGYVEGVATAVARQGEGLGSLAMSRVARVVRRDFEMGALSTGHHRIYERLGWERWRGPTFVRRGLELVRTPGDDDALMVLRFGPSRGVDLTAPISCDARAGDDW